MIPIRPGTLIRKGKDKVKEYGGKDADLTSGNRDGGTSHETAYGRGGDKLYDPTKSQKSYAKDDETLCGLVGGLIWGARTKDLQTRRPL